MIESWPIARGSGATDEECLQARARGFVSIEPKSRVGEEQERRRGTVAESKRAKMATVGLVRSDRPKCVWKTMCDDASGDLA